MSETYNKDWASEIKSVDVESDGKHNEKQDRVHLSAISLLNDFKARSLPPEQFNKLVEEVKDILRRKNIDEGDLKIEYGNLLNIEKNIFKLNKSITDYESHLVDFKKDINKKGITDFILDEVFFNGEIGKSYKNNYINTRKPFLENYKELKNFYSENFNKLTPKQQSDFFNLLNYFREKLNFKIEDPSLKQMLSAQVKNTGEQINSVKKTIETKLNPDIELFKKASTFNFEAVINIYKTGKQGEFEKYLIDNPKERSKLLKGVKDKKGFCPDVGSDKFIILVGKLQQIEFNEKRKQLEKKLKNRLGEDYGKQLLEKIDNELKNNSCTFNLIKIISDFNKNLDGKIKKLSLDEIRFYVGETIYNENSKIIFELNSFLYKNDLTINDIDGKSEKEIRNILGSRKININEQNEIINLYFKYKNGNIAEKRFSFLSTPDIKTIIDGKEKGKSNNDIAAGLGKGNPAFKQFNSNYNISSSVISVPTSNRSEFFGEIFKNIDSGKGGNENLTFSNGFNVNISKNGNGYIINYGDKKEICSSKEEVINVINMGEYIQKLGLGFLFGGINRVIYRIKEKGDGKINEKDGLSNDEMKLGLKSIGEALIPGFDSTKTEIKDLEIQFTDKDIFNAKITKAKTDKSNKFSDKLKDNIGNISSLEQLSRVLYPANSKGKDFSIDSFINNL